MPRIPPDRSPSFPKATLAGVPERRRLPRRPGARATITRRRVLGGGAALGLASLLAACGEDGGEQAGGASGGSSGPWELTDDRGQTISLEQQPQRVVAYVSIAGALWDYGIRPVGTFGPLVREDGTPDPQAGNMDVEAVESVGDVWGELNIDKLASLEPDLIVTTTPDPASNPFWYIQEEAFAQVEELAPIMTLQFAARPLTESLEKYAELARALSADADAAITEGQAELERATADLEAFAAERSDLSVLAVSTTPDNLYIGNPAGHADLGYFIDAGLQVVTPEAAGPEGRVLGDAGLGAGRQVPRGRDPVRRPDHGRAARPRAARRGPARLGAAPRGPGPAGPPLARGSSPQLPDLRDGPGRARRGPRRCAEGDLRAQTPARRPARSQAK